MVAEVETMRPANDEMVQGYRDGWDLDNPLPSENRSHSYQHGFANARDDRCGHPRDYCKNLSRMADEAMARDDAIARGES
jgi:hypothetical protein